MRLIIIISVVGLFGCSMMPEQPISVDNELVAVRVDPDLNQSIDDVDGVNVSEISYRETVEINAAYKKNLATGVVNYSFEAGFLKPQLIAFLANHPRVKHERNVVWLASDNYLWPSNFIVEGDSFERALSRVLVPYKLEALFRPNDVVVIQPKR